MTDRIAISIGVANAGRRLPPLPGAIADAKRFAAWAEANGYCVTIVTDEFDPVTISQLANIIRTAVDEVPERLVIFYSGHGTFSAIGDFWLLSRSDDDSNEAVNVNLSLINAKRQPIRQIAVFADACRATVDDPATIGGSSIFPRTTQRTNQPEWDHFFATGAGSISQEADGGDPAKAYGVFSDCLFEALEVGTQDAVEKRGESGPGQWVVSSSRLANWLRTTVPVRTGAIPGAVVQFPDAVGGWIRPNDVYLEVPPERMAVPDFMKLEPEVLNEMIPSRLGHGHSERFDRPEIIERGVAYRDGARRFRIAEQRERIRRDREGFIRAGRARDGIDRARARNQAKLVLQRDDLHRSDAELAMGDRRRTGLIVFGARIRHVASSREGSARAYAEGEATLVRRRGDHALTVAVLLADGMWFATVMLPRFAGIASFADGAVIGLNYQAHGELARSEHDAMFRHWMALMDNGEAPAAEFEDVGNKIRMDKHVNPALGILAAYAYERAGNLHGIDSIIGYFAEKAQSVPFDIAMLSTYQLRRKAGRVIFAGEPVRHRGKAFKDCKIAGTFPLMSRGWSMLDPADPGIHPELLPLRAGLQPSLWTMFDPTHGARLAELIEQGEL